MLYRVVENTLCIPTGTLRWPVVDGRINFGSTLGRVLFAGSIDVGIRQGLIVAGFPTGS